MIGKQGFSGLPPNVSLAFLRGRHIYFVKVASKNICRELEQNWEFHEPVLFSGKEILDFLPGIQASNLKAYAFAKRLM